MFEEELCNALRLRSMGLNTQAVKEYSNVMEQTLEKFYKEIWAHLNSGEKQRLLDIERRFSKKRTPIDTLGLRKWIEFYREAEMPSLLSKYLNIGPSLFNYEILIDINGIRNRCIHEEYKASQEEVDKIRTFIVKLLLETRLIEKEPTEIRKLADKESRPKIVISADKIRLLLAGDPLFDFQGVIEKDFGKFYDVSTKWEFVGAFVRQDTIHILVNEIDSGYHEDVAEDVYDELAKMIKKKIQSKLPEISNFKIQIDIAFDGPDWGETAVEMQL